MGEIFNGEIFWIKSSQTILVPEGAWATLSHCRRMGGGRLRPRSRLPISTRIEGIGGGNNLWNSIKRLVTEKGGSQLSNTEVYTSPRSSTWQKILEFNLSLFVPSRLLISSPLSYLLLVVSLSRFWCCNHIHTSPLSFFSSYRGSLVSLDGWISIIIYIGWVSLFWMCEYSRSGCTSIIIYIFKCTILGATPLKSITQNPLPLPNWNPFLKAINQNRLPVSRPTKVKPSFRSSFLPADGGRDGRCTPKPRKPKPPLNLIPLWNDHRIPFTSRAPLGNPLPQRKSSSTAEILFHSGTPLEKRISTHSVFPLGSNP